jgi:hypothetical protein
MIANSEQYERLNQPRGAVEYEQRAGKRHRIRHQVGVGNDMGALLLARLLLEFLTCRLDIVLIGLSSFVS